MTLRTSVVGLAVAGLFVLAGCGDDHAGAALEPDDGVVDDAVTVLGLDIDFDLDAYVAAAGPVTFTYGNEGSLLHSLVIEGVDGFRLVVSSKGDVETGSTTLESGDYVVYCDIAGHRNAGMEATLTVE